jgi:hypothetical protein
LNYLEQHDEQRSQFETSKGFVLHQLRHQLKLQQQVHQQQQFNGKQCKLPQSELARASKLDADARSAIHVASQQHNNRKKAKLTSNISYEESNDHVLHENESNTNKNNDTGTSLQVSHHKDYPTLPPDYLLGHCLRLYCPLDNQYHTGRIIDWRQRWVPLVTSTTTTTSRKRDDDLYWDSEFADVEYYVRFAAGTEYRKVSYSAWLILEEHSIAIAATHVGGIREIPNSHSNRKRGSHNNSSSSSNSNLPFLFPGIIWWRTSLELLPVLSQLDASLYQWYPLGATVEPYHPSWSLASFWGDEQYQLLNLQEEAMDFDNYFTIENTHRRQGKNPSDSNPHFDLAMQLHQVEWQEQQRVRTWREQIADIESIPPFHPRGIRIRDEFQMDPPLWQRRDRDPCLCPSIVLDFDRTYLVQAIQKEWRQSPPSSLSWLPTRDVAATMVCQLVSPSPQILHDLHDRDPISAAKGITNDEE